MTVHSSTFGPRFQASQTSDERLQLEREEGQRTKFANLDRLFKRLVLQVMRGHEPVVPLQLEREEQPSLLGLSEEERTLIAEGFDFTKQEEQGAWFLSREDSVPSGFLNLTYWGRRKVRWTMNLSRSRHGKAQLAEGPEAFAIWAWLIPLFEQLTKPIYLRSVQAGKRKLKAQAKDWVGIDETYKALGLALDDQLAVFRPGNGWVDLDEAGQIRAREALLQGLAEQAAEEVGDRARIWSIAQLLDRYYAKAKNGQAKSTDVLNRALHRPFAGFFGGDWLDFLNYIGEDPHPNEELVSSLPEARLQVGGGEEVAQVAEAEGLPIQEVEAMLAAFFERHDAASPVERRVAALKRFWQSFEAIHARQVPGMPSLWGLLEEGRGKFLDDSWPPDYEYGLYLELQPAELNAEINELWGSTMLGVNPKRLVSEPWPQWRIEDTFGPALSFWHKAALTAWACCEPGIYPYHNLRRLRSDYKDEVSALEAGGFPIQDEFFAELITSETQLGPEEDNTKRSTSSHEVRPGLSIEIEMTGPTRRGKRKGFEVLRDIVTRHRRAWAQEHLDGYLHWRWETDLRAAAYEYQRASAGRGKPPTPRQAIKLTEPALTRWLGGDLDQLYRAIGQPAPGPPARELLLPANRYAFGRAVVEGFGGKPVSGEQPFDASVEEVKAWREERKEATGYEYLAKESFRYVQLWEALEQPPELKQFRASVIKTSVLARGGDPAEVWERYQRVVQDVISRVTQKPSAEVSSREGGDQDGGTGLPASDMSPPAAWYPDPQGKARLRYWDGSGWTEHTAA